MPLAGKRSRSKPDKEKTTLTNLSTRQEETTFLSTKFVKIEKNLVSLGFFTPSSKKSKSMLIKTITFSKEIDGKRMESRVTVAPVAGFGLPTTADQDKYLALQKIITNIRQRTGEVRNPIGVTSAELLQLLGKRVETGKNYADIDEWLKRMTLTGVISEGAVYFAGKKVWASDTFHVFERAVSFGKQLPDGTIADQNYIWLSDWQLENINNNYLLPVDFEAYTKLKNHIAKALAPLLQIWLYATREEGRFEKRYDEICQLLNIRNYKHLSKIKEKLSPALNELKSHGYLSKWRIEKTSDGSGCKIIFYHGEKFYGDRFKRISQKQQTHSKLIPQKAQKPTAKRASNQEVDIQATPTTAESLTDEQTDEQQNLIARLQKDFSVAAATATILVTQHLEASKRQLGAWPYRDQSRIQDKSGWIIRAIEQDYELPQAYLDVLKEQDKHATSPAGHVKQAEVALQLVRYFHKLARDIDDYKPYANGKEMSQAATLLTTYGLEKASFIVAFAASEAKKTDFQMRTFGAVLQYESDAIAEYERRERELERKREKEAAQSRQQERYIEARLQVLAPDQYSALYEEAKRQVLADVPTLVAYQEEPMVRSMIKEEMVRMLDRQARQRSEQ